MRHGCEPSGTQRTCSLSNHSESGYDGLELTASAVTAFSTFFAMTGPSSPEGYSSVVELTFCSFVQVNLCLAGRLASPINWFGHRLTTVIYKSFAPSFAALPISISADFVRPVLTSGRSNESLHPFELPLN